MITADHGCDPSTPSTDHSREYVPLLLYGKEIAAGRDLGTRPTFADTGETAAALLGVDAGLRRRIALPAGPRAGLTARKRKRDTTGGRRAVWAPIT